MTHGSFFAVSREQFYQAADIGLGAAVAYLVIACGTGRDHARSKWSANAVAEYTGINHKRARAYIASLEEAGLLANVGTKAKPWYELALGENPVWLPNAIICGVEGEPRGALFRIRQAKDVDLLRMFVDLYDNQNLGVDGGIHPQVARSLWICREAAEHKALTVYEITSSQKMTTNPQHPTVAYYWGKGGRDYWWNRFKQLVAMGLIVEAVNLYDGPVASDGDWVTEDDVDGEYLLTVWGGSGDERNHFAFEAHLEANVGVTNETLQEVLEADDYHYLAALPQHVAHPEAVGIYRLRHTARTKAASTWWAKLQEANRDINRSLSW